MINDPKRAFYWIYWFTEIDLPLSEWRIYEWLHEVYWRTKFKVPYPDPVHWVAPARVSLRALSNHDLPIPTPHIDIAHMKNAPTPHKEPPVRPQVVRGNVDPEFLRIRDKIFTRYRRLFRLLARM
jgi:hypothetical protein